MILALLGLAALGAAPLVRADEPVTTPPPAGERPHMDRAQKMEHRLRMLDEKLQLTDAQKQQITAAWSAAEAQRKALHDDATVAKEDRRAKMRDLAKATHDQVRAVLTPEQQKTFDALPPPGRGHRGHHRGEGRKGDRDRSADADKAEDSTPKP